MCVKIITHNHKTMNFNQFFTSKNNSILHNVFVLYFIFFISLINFYVWISQNNALSVMTFVIIGMLTAFFNKNMVVVLFVALTMTNILLPLQQ